MSALGPFLRPDRSGYFLGDESVDGFTDRLDLPRRQRVILAKMAQRLTPDRLDPVQVELLAGADEAVVPSALIDAFARDEALVGEVGAQGLLEHLTERERDLAAHPWSLKSVSRPYPLRIGHVIELVRAAGHDVTDRQLRHWADAGLLPSHRINGQRYFLRAAVLRAMLYAKLSPQQIASLMAVAQGSEQGLLFTAAFGSLLGAGRCVTNVYAEPWNDLAEAGQILLANISALTELPIQRIDHASEGTMDEPVSQARRTDDLMPA
jgi:DNA-binding transcriptional MerR regulator